MEIAARETNAGTYLPHVYIGHLNNAPILLLGMYVWICASQVNKSFDSI